ncbi:hypothetical protein LZ575_10375 [Antarcticibacterium sp. 1MA-6-2]|uniref:hypothetical protein n=1 Tax=Antarcticibacterium sp. 1MA-6-2 TaxID=2908210 RepID=UPI001F37DCA1|nr:hypothetical protein [Antarcticibacterium sp. 1MA-6-2]UJH92789.1 hypothetical protein LZ575_10375 [Antarcticibacterium sp. 1MA-6-2]
MSKVWNIARNSGAKLLFYGSEETLQFIKEIHGKHPVEAQFIEFVNLDDFLILSRDVQKDDNLIIILSRKDKESYHSNMAKIPGYLNEYFRENSFILVYPMQLGVVDSTGIDYRNPAILEPIEKLDEIGKTIGKMFRR